MTFFSAMLTLSFTLLHVKLPSFILKFPHNPDPIPIPKRKVIQVVFKQIGVVFAVRGTMKSRHTESDSGKDLIWAESGGAERENNQGEGGVEVGGVCGAGAEKARWILCGLGSCQIIIFQMLEGEGEKQEE